MRYDKIKYSLHVGPPRLREVAPRVEPHAVPAADLFVLRVEPVEVEAAHSGERVVEALQVQAGGERRHEGRAGRVVDGGLNLPPKVVVVVWPLLRVLLRARRGGAWWNALVGLPRCIDLCWRWDAGNVHGEWALKLYL